MIEDLSFVVCVLVLAIFGFLFFKITILGNSLKLMRLTIPSIFLVAYIVFMVIPSIIQFYRSPHPIRYTYFLAMQSVLISFPIGVALANALFRHPSRIIANFLSSSLVKTRQDTFVLPLFLLLIMFSIVVLITYFSVADYIPLTMAFTRYGEMDSEMVRFSIYRVPDTIHYAYALTARFILPFCTLYTYFMAYVYKGIWRSIFRVIFLFTLFNVFLSLERSQGLGIFIMLSLAHYFKNNKIVLWKQVVVAVVVIFLVGGVVSTVQHNNPFSGLKDLWKLSIMFVVNRVWMDPSYMAISYFEEFSDPSTFLYGKSIKLFSLFGMEYHNVISPSFVAESWLNFGWFGVIIWTCIWGFIFQFVQLKFFRKKSIPTLIGYILLLLNGVWIIYGHVLATMSVSVYLLTIVFLTFQQSTKGAGGVRQNNVSGVLQPKHSGGAQGNGRNKI